MKPLLILFALAASSLFADWSDVAHLAPGTKVEVQTRDGEKLRSEFVSAAQDSLVVKARTVTKAQIRQVKVYDPGRRIRRGVLWTLIGAAAGAGAGAAACLHCGNEGTTNPYIGPGAAGGAALGLIGFLTSPWKTIYK